MFRYSIDKKEFKPFNLIVLFLISDLKQAVNQSLTALLSFFVQMDR